MAIEPLPGHRGPRPLTTSLQVLARGIGAPSGEWVDRIPEEWSQLVGRRLATMSRPVPAGSGRLIVEVAEPAAAEQFRYLVGELPATVNRWAGEPVVDTVLIRVVRPGDDRSRW